MIVMIYFMVQMKLHSKSGSSSNHLSVCLFGKISVTKFGSLSTVAANRFNGFQKSPRDVMFSFC